jgi:hypothetical protein
MFPFGAVILPRPAGGLAHCPAKSSLSAAGRAGEGDQAIGANPDALTGST